MSPNMAGIAWANHRSKRGIYGNLVSPCLIAGGYEQRAKHEPHVVVNAMSSDQNSYTDIRYHARGQ